MTTPYEILRHPVVTEKSNYQVGKLTPVCIRCRQQVDKNHGQGRC